MGETNMATIFSTTVLGTPLFSRVLTPTTKLQYVAILLFIISLAITLRLLLALRPILEATTWYSAISPSSSYSSSSFSYLHHHHDHRRRPSDNEAGNKTEEFDISKKHEMVSTEDLLDRVGEEEETEEERRYRGSRTQHRGSWLITIIYEIRTRWHGTTLWVSLGRACFEVLVGGIAYLL